MDLLELTYHICTYCLLIYKPLYPFAITDANIIASKKSACGS